ncbi:MAG: hypothetical protein ACN4G0_01235 [Polyangiales bacterium]
MKKSLLIALLLLTPVFVLGAPSSSSAQQPKMDIKLFAGLSGTTFVSMLETGRERDTFLGWQIGFGPRVRRRAAFIEILFSFNRWAYAFEGVSEDGVPFSAIGRVNSFELPLIMGYIPYKNPFFKLFLYAGYVNHFNTKIVSELTADFGFGEETITVKSRPKEVDFAIYQAIGRVGVNVDLAMFNLDFNYSISLNSATKTSYRTSYHQLQVNLAYLF